MKKILAALLALTLVIGLCACSGGSSEGTTEMAGMPNPIKEVASSQELAAATGIALEAPEGATDVRYSYIEGGDILTSQVDFTFMDQQFCYRAQETSLTDMGLPTELNETEEYDVTKIDDTAFNISGICYGWSSARPASVQERTGVCMIAEEGAGYVAWIDVVPGILYSLGTDEKADPVTLITVADQTFVPVQGEAE